jgi:hypothetical protein
MAALELSAEQLQQAFQACRRADWPESLEEAMNDRTFAHLVRIQARREHMRAEERAKQQAQRPRAARQLQAMPLPHHPPVLDHKRLAAGERDDD